jgi:hypothetical protein
MNIKRDTSAHTLRDLAESNGREELERPTGEMVWIGGTEADARQREAIGGEGQKQSLALKPIGRGGEADPESNRSGENVIRRSLIRSRSAEQKP